MKAFFTGAMKILKVLTQAPKDVIDTDVELVYDQTTIGHGKDYLEVIFRHPTEKWSFQARIAKDDAATFLENAKWLSSQTSDLENITEDPHCGVPVGYHSERDQYKVVGFSAPAGRDAKRLKVRIKYDNDKTDRPYSTTLSYLTVLYDYFNSIDLESFVEKHL